MPAIPRTTILTMVVLCAAVVGLQALQEKRQFLGLPAGVTGNVLYVRSPEFMKRAALSYRAVAADIYWIRAIQHYGGTNLSTDANKQYDLLYPLLDLTTTLDPYLDIAYGFGAIFLAEPYPGGAGRPDEAIALLQKALRAQPDTWRFAEDIGFVHYWWRQDYPAAADWFERASRMHDAPNWMKPLAAVTLAQGGNRVSSRTLWTQVMTDAGADWLKVQARFRLTQLDAMDAIDALQRAVEVYHARVGAWPQSWQDMVRAGHLRGIPIDSTGHPFRVDPASGVVSLAPDSPLNPLPDPERP